jgi:hypothetical protein
LPGIIAVSINCYGHEGPWSERPGWEQLAQTVTGMAYEHGGGETPSIVPAALTDYTIGHLAALGVLCALARRAGQGGSWHVRVSLARTAMRIQSLPRISAGAVPTGVDSAALGPWWMEMETAWGRLARLGPVTRMSETPPRWDLPPAPLGTHAPRWEGNVPFRAAEALTARWESSDPGGGSSPCDAAVPELRFSAWSPSPIAEVETTIPGGRRQR